MDRDLSPTVSTLFAGEEIAASGDTTSEAIAVGHASGYFSTHFKFTGSGTLKLEYLCSNDGSTFTAPDTNSIVTGKAAGTHFKKFDPPPCLWIKIKASETGGANKVTFDATMGCKTLVM